jgi:hypothetical protein
MRPWREGAAGPLVSERRVAQCDGELDWTNRLMRSPARQWGF